MKSSSTLLRLTRKALKYLLLGLVFTISGYYVLYSHVFYCQTISFSTFTKVNKKLYVSEGIADNQRVRMYRSIVRAQQRVKSFWGGLVGNATIILCSSPDEYQKYCHSNEGAGCSLGTPWGDSYIVLNPYGLNEDVVSHEMCHDELFARLGWWKTAIEIPQWFNEGLALMLDYRFVSDTDSLKRYHNYKDEWMYLTNGAQEVLELRNLESMKGFFGGDSRHVMLAYMTAGMEVSYWLMLTGKNSVRVLVDAVHQGNGFTKTYDSMKKAGIARAGAPQAHYPLR